MDLTKLLDALEKANLVDPVTLRSAVMEHKRWGNDVVRSLLDKHALAEADLVRVMAQVWGVPHVDLTEYRPKMGLVEKLSAELADKFGAIPIACEGNFIDVAFAIPSDEAIDAIRVHTRLNVRPHIAGPRNIDRLVARYYGRMNIGGYQVDPRVTSGNFLSSDVIDFEVGEASMSIPVDLSGFDDEPSMRAAQGTGLPALEAQLKITGQALARAEQRIELLEAHVGRDEDVLRRLFGFMVDKGIGTREEIVALLS